MPDAIQIGQCEQPMHLSKILRDPAVAHLRIAPQPLDYELGMLADGTHSGIAPVARALALIQGPSSGAAFAHIELQSDERR
jgi:hypothetical protein